MPYAVLERQINALPEGYAEAVAQDAQLLQYTSAALSQKETVAARIGFGKGLFTDPDDMHYHNGSCVIPA